MFSNNYTTITLFLVKKVDKNEMLCKWITNQDSEADCNICCYFYTDRKNFSRSKLNKIKLIKIKLIKIKLIKMI